MTFFSDRLLAMVKLLVRGVETGAWGGTFHGDAASPFFLNTLILLNSVYIFNNKIRDRVKKMCYASRVYQGG
jgi:hypothetical protein